MEFMLEGLSENSGKDYSGKKTYEEFVNILIAEGLIKKIDDTTTHEQFIQEESKLLEEKTKAKRGV